MDKCSSLDGSIRDRQLAPIDSCRISEHRVTILENGLRRGIHSSQQDIDQQKLQYAALIGVGQQWLKNAFPIRSTKQKVTCG
jgi:hypothetical protein